MRAESTFAVTEFETRAWSPEITTAVQFGDIDMVKTFTGDLEGRSITRFLGGMTADQKTGIYVALELFEGLVNGRSGSFGFTHTQTLVDGLAVAMNLAIAPGSATGELAGITGGGGIVVEPDGTHRIWLDYELPA